MYGDAAPRVPGSVVFNMKKHLNMILKLMLKEHIA